MRGLGLCGHWRVLQGLADRTGAGHALYDVFRPAVFCRSERHELLFGNLFLQYMAQSYEQQCQVHRGSHILSLHSCVSHGRGGEDPNLGADGWEESA